MILSHSGAIDNFFSSFSNTQLLKPYFATFGKAGKRLLSLTTTHNKKTVRISNAVPVHFCCSTENNTSKIKYFSVAFILYFSIYVAQEPPKLLHTKLCYVTSHGSPMGLQTLVAPTTWFRLWFRQMFIYLLLPINIMKSIWGGRYDQHFISQYE